MPGVAVDETVVFPECYPERYKDYRDAKGKGEVDNESPFVIEKDGFVR